MTNQELADVFYDIADMLEIEGVQWEPRAYRRAALTISTLPVDIRQIYEEGKLTELEGIGESISKSIEQYIKTGSIKKYKDLEKKYPLDFSSFRKIQGLGPKRAYALYKKLKIRTVDELKTALDKGQISKLEGFGEKSQEQLKHNLETFFKVKEERKMLGYVIDYFESLVNKLRKSSLFDRVEIAGSTRRMKETVGDLDILTTSSKPEGCMDFFTKLKEVKEVIVKGDTKTSVKLDIGLNCDIRIVKDDSFGAAMQYFTGNKDHNIKLRKIAISKGYKLNEYGVFRGNKIIARKTEKDVYAALGLKEMEPELRENMGEIEAAQKGSLPTIVKYDEVISDLHLHTIDSDGANTLEEMVSEAKKLGEEYFAVTNHSKSLPIANGLDDKRFSAFNKKVEKLNEHSDFKVLKGVELEILKDGSLDLAPSTLKNMDFVVGALHQWTKMDKKALTNRVIKAIESGAINVLAHPTGRKIGERSAFDLDYNRIFESCKKNEVFLEIDGFPERSDLPFDMVKQAKEYGIRFTMGSDAHRKDQLRFIKLAAAIGRRGWLEKKDVVNVLGYHELLKLKR
jgi:DNA polymerase (family 10)